MKKIILMLIFILGSFVFAETAGNETELFLSPNETKIFLSPNAQFYISNQKEWFLGITPDDSSIEWEKKCYFISILPVGKNYKIAYIPFDETKSYDKEGYPILTHRITRKYTQKTRKEENIPVAVSYSFDNTFFGAHPGIEIKKGKRYERKSYQVLSENELNILLKSRNAKRLDSTTEKYLKAWATWLIYNAG